MLGYAIMFTVIGFILGIVLKAKYALNLSIYISIGWAFFHGFWAIATFFELFFGVLLAAVFIGKMKRIDDAEKNTYHSFTQQQETIPLSLEKDNTRKNQNFIPDDEEPAISGEIIDNMTKDEYEIYLNEGTIPKRLQESQDNNDKEYVDFDSRNSLDNRKDPAAMSEAERFFELQYLHTILVSFIKDKNLREALERNAMTGVSDIESFAKIHDFNMLLNRLTEVTQKSLPELFDNNSKGLNKCIKKANSEKAIKNAVTQLLKEQGEKGLAHKIAELLNQHIENRAAAREFVLQELDAASCGTDTAQKFVSQSGFDKNEYKGAMNHSSWENDDTISHLQQYFRVFTLKIDNLNTMLQVNLRIVDYIMKFWKLGKYKNS